MTGKGKYGEKRDRGSRGGKTEVFPIIPHSA